MRSVRQRSKAIAASATIVIVILIAAFVFTVVLPTALTTESAHREQNPTYVERPLSVHARLNESVTAGNLTFRVRTVMDGNNAEARRAWAIAMNLIRYTPLNPIQGNKYVIINATVTNAMTSNTSFRYSDVILVGNDGRSYYANYPACNASCSKSLDSEQLKVSAAYDVYVAFSIPDEVTPTKIVYGTTNPAIVVDLV
jgi:hypothetical protein